MGTNTTIKQVANKNYVIPADTTTVIDVKMSGSDSDTAKYMALGKYAVYARVEYDGGANDFLHVWLNGASATEDATILGDTKYVVYSEEKSGTKTAKITVTNLSASAAQVKVMVM